MIINSLPLLIFLLLIPAIILLLSASTIFHTGKYSKKNRIVSYIIAVLSLALFSEFIRHFTLPPTSFAIHVLVSNTCVILAYCLLLHVCYLLTFRHARLRIISSPIICYVPLLIYAVFATIAWQFTFFNPAANDISSIQMIAIILSICSCISIFFTLGLLIKGINSTSSKKRMTLYRNIIITLSVTVLLTIILTYATPFIMFIYEPALLTILLTGTALILSIRKIAFSSSLKSNYKMIVDVSPIAIAVLDANLNILEVNRKAQELFGFTVDNPIQKYFDSVENEADIQQCLQKLQQKKSLRDYPLTIYKKHKNEPIHLSIEALFIYVEHSHNYYFMIRDVTKEREQELLNFHLAYHDPLTDLHNRAYFVSNVEKSLRQLDSNHRSALVLIDINYFKQINDTHGHQVGDLVLIHITKVLQQHAKTASIIARLGGDEFVLYYNMLQSIQSFDEEILAIRQAFKTNFFTFSDLAFEIVPSFGHAMFPTDARDFEGLYHMADERMYQDKHHTKEHTDPPF